MKPASAPASWLAACILAACATPLSSMRPARTLGAHDLAVGWTGGLALPSGTVGSLQETGGPSAAAALALGAGGFGQEVGLRWGASDRLELAARWGIDEAALGARWALLVPDARDDLDVRSFVRAGGSLAMVMGRTWSDFASLWLAGRATIDGYDLDAELDGRSVSVSGSATLLGLTGGLRVGFRTFFVGLELTAARIAITTSHETLQGLLLYPAFGLSFETR
jgi:hypothetical protein